MAPRSRKIISLGIGDTTKPIPEHILSGLVNGAKKLGTVEGYSGYGAAGQGDLREKIAASCYGDRVKASEVFVSDGAKCDISRLQLMFGSDVVSAVQDPSYPSRRPSVMMGQTGEVNKETGQFDKLVYMPCAAADDFFPDLAKGTPTSIFEIEGSRQCAIEVNSFSKCAGFTGARLGWTVVPDELTYSDGRRHGVPRPEGKKEIDTLIDYYLGNAEILRGLADDLGLDHYGGVDSPYARERISKIDMAGPIGARPRRRAAQPEQRRGPA
ncbi:transferase [Aureococcus anophagefferens]|nr:transferase [Aureococcus anophagefferens]